MAFFSMSQIEDAVLELLPPFLSAPFSVSSLTDAVQKKLSAGPDARDRIERQTELLLATLPELFLSGDMCYPKEAFFSGTRFRVIPGAVEREKNILLSGARFAPFCDPEIFPDGYTIRSGKKKCRPVSLSLRFSEIAPAFLLLGHSGLIDYLAAESNENLARLRASRNVERIFMEITAFDLTDFYRAHSFREGDGILVTVTSWKDASFRLEYAPASEEPARPARDAFLLHFESALLKVCETEHDSMEIPDQISHAYLQAFLDGHDLRKTPDFALDNYPAAMREIAIRRSGPEWTLVPADSVDEPGMERVPEPEQGEKESCSCGHDHSHGDAHDPGSGEKTVSGIQPDQFSASSGTLESLEAILAERNSLLTPAELHAYAIDSVANGMERFGDFNIRIRSLLGIRFADDAQEAAFLNFLEDDWELVNEYFNPEFEMEKTPLRTRLLDLSEQRADLFLRFLSHFREVRKTDVPEDPARALARFHRDVAETLSLFSMDAPLPEGRDREQMEFRIEDLEDAWEELQERIELLMTEDPSSPQPQD